MKRIVHLVGTAVLVAACAGPPQGSTALGPGDTAKSGEAAGAQIPGNARAGTTTWAVYREFNFASTSAEIPTSDTLKLREIVAYVASDHSLDVRIDGNLGSSAVSQAERELNDRRIASVRQALMDTGAGVASYKIQIGLYGVPLRRRPGQILVLIGPRTGSLRSPL